MTTTLTDYKHAEQLDFDLDQAISEAGGRIEDPGPKPKKKRFLTAKDGASDEIVPLYPGEHVEPKRW